MQPTRIPRRIVQAAALAFASGAMLAQASVLKDAELRARLEASGYEPLAGTPADVEQRGKKERDMWATITKDIKVE